MSMECDRIYFDPLDGDYLPAAYLGVHQGNRRIRGRGTTLEDCLRSVIREGTGENWLFRRADPTEATILVWEIPNPVIRGKRITGTPGPLLGGYVEIYSYHRKISTSPEIAERYGILEVIIHYDDEHGAQFNYLDRTGKIRPLLGMRVSSDFLDDGIDDHWVRNEFEQAITDTMTPLYPLQNSTAPSKA